MHPEPLEAPYMRAWGGPTATPADDTDRPTGGLTGPLDALEGVADFSAPADGSLAGLMSARPERTTYFATDVEDSAARARGRLVTLKVELQFRLPAYISDAPANELADVLADTLPDDMRLFAAVRACGEAGAVLEWRKSGFEVEGLRAGLASRAAADGWVEQYDVGALVYADRLLRRMAGG